MNNSRPDQKPLKIGIDTRLLSRPLTGIGRYSAQMCHALLNSHAASLYLYSCGPLNADLTLSLKPAKIKSYSHENRWLRQYWSAFSLPQWAVQDSIDVFWGPAHRLPSRLPQHIARVVTVHDLVWKCAPNTMRPLSRALEHYLMPKAIQQADHIVTDSFASADAIIEEFKLNPDRLTVIPLGSDHIKPSENTIQLEKLAITKPYMLFVGTLEPRKNLVRLLQAYAKLAINTREKMQLVIAGGKGWGSMDLMQKVKQLNLEADVKLLGYVDQAVLASLYTHAQFLVMPSLYEGFGLPLVEAMRCGTPVLTSNNSSMIEVAGNAGLLIEPLEVGSIAQGLETLIHNDALRAQLAQNAVQNAARFNWQQAGHALLNVFKAAIDLRKSRAL